MQSLVANTLRWSGVRLSNAISRSFQTATAGARAAAAPGAGAPTAAPAPPPTWEQLRNHALTCAVPMVGFGFMDNTVMIHAGNAIDLTLGVTFGLSTLTAACMGQMCSDVAGLCFGDTVEGLVARNLSLPVAGLSSAQRKLRVVRNVGLLGQCVGVVCGCALGMVNLLFIDTGLSQQLKGLHGIDAGEFSIELSNEDMDDEETRITLRGPDRPGLLASTSASVAALGANITTAMVETKNEGMGRLRLTFHVTHDGEPIPTEDFEKWGDAVMDSCQHPAAKLMEKNADLEARNVQLKAKILEEEAVIAAEESELKAMREKLNEEEEELRDLRAKVADAGK